MSTRMTTVYPDIEIVGWIPTVMVQTMIGSAVEEDNFLFCVLGKEIDKMTTTTLNHNIC